MWAFLLEAFANHGEFFLTDHALVIYEAYVNIVEDVICLNFSPCNGKNVLMLTGKQRRLCNVFPLMGYAAVPDGAAARTKPSRPSSSLENIFTLCRKKCLPVPAAPEKLSR